MSNTFYTNVKELSRKIAFSKVIQKNKEQWQNESDVVAISLVEIKESFDKIYNDIIHRFKEDPKVDEILWDIGEEFRHILYHIKDMKYFSYLFDTDIENEKLPHNKTDAS